jgi:hypothetical protein
MAASASANELSVETRTAGAHTIVIVTGRVTVDSSPRLRPVLRARTRDSTARRSVRLPASLHALGFDPSECTRGACQRAADVMRTSTIRP